MITYTCVGGRGREQGRKRLVCAHMHAESFWSHSKSHVNCELCVYFVCVQVQLWGLQGYSWLGVGSDCSAPTGGHRLWLRSGRIGRHAERSGGLQLQRHSQLPPEYRLVCVHVYTHIVCLTFYTWTADLAAFMALSHENVQTNFLVFIMLSLWNVWEGAGGNYLSKAGLLIHYTM